MLLRSEKSTVNHRGTVTLEQSYRHCARIARRAASNFYWSFWLLPREKRRAMCALYAFSRHTDDLSDNDEPPEVRRSLLADWRAMLTQSLIAPCNDPVLTALADTVHRYKIPHPYLFDLIDGVEMDLDTRRYATFAELRQYCHRVASAVGLACIHVWGFDSAEVYEPAAACGLAFQLTNILRDLKEDARRDRIYLPLDDLRKFDYQPDELLAGHRNERFTALMRFEVERAEQLYCESKATSRYLRHDGQRIFGMMWATYRGLLEEIKRRDGDVFSRHVQLDLGQKLRIAASQFWRPKRQNA
jgi:phytoene synthase